MFGSSSLQLGALLTVASSLVSAGTIRRAEADTLPTVDLGTSIQQATSINETGAYYNFSNIRYAQSPTDDLRFKAPVAPTGRNTTVDNGSVGRVCPQAYPDWIIISQLFLAAEAAGTSFDYNTTEAYLQSIGLTHYSVPDSRITEDCLFLDVIVPEAIFDNSSSSGAPVMVWIHGGGYTTGSKTGSGDPAGLIARSQTDGSDGIIYVSINYRLGAFGWSGGSAYDDFGGLTNAGLYDQRLALQWVQDNIHLFGGDPDRVTVFGESAGGGSIMHQITAFGGEQAAPFQQAITQSAAFQLIPTTSYEDLVISDFLAILNVSTLAEANALPSATLISANIAVVEASQYGSFTYGPFVDGVIVPDLPGKLLLEGKFDSSLNVMTGHNADEGLLFTDPRVTTDAAFDAEVAAQFYTASASTLAYITETLYPPVFDGTYPYTNNVERLDFLTSESTFTCNTDYLNRAFDNQTYSYLFAVPPATHGKDVPYTYYNGESTVTSPSTALALQTYLTSFAKNGVPGGNGWPVFPIHGDNATELVLNTTIYTRQDETANSRCAWWQLAEYA